MRKRRVAFRLFINQKTDNDVGGCHLQRRRRDEAGYNPMSYLVLRTLMSASRAPAAAGDKFSIDIFASKASNIYVRF